MNGRFEVKISAKILQFLKAGNLVQPGHEILQKWEERVRRHHPRMEITREGLVLGAGTILTKVEVDEGF